MDDMTNMSTETMDTQEPQVNEQANNFIELDGEKYTPEQIKEWKLGNVRLSDYTRKTQEVAQSRKMNEQAIELFNFLQENPTLVDVMNQEYTKMSNGDSVDKNGNVVPQEVLNQINGMQQQLANMQLYKELSSLKSKYKDFDEDKVLMYAADNGILNLEIAYKAMRDVDEESIKTKILEELKSNRGVANNLISSHNGVPNNNTTLTNQEKAMASKLGMSEEDYQKWKT